MKFNIGDKVKVTCNAYQHQHNQTGTIIAIALGHNHYPYDIKFDEPNAQKHNYYHWGDFELELVVEPKPVKKPVAKFVQTLGFNTELLKEGTPIYITDRKQVTSGLLVSWDITIDGFEYRRENKTGTYIVREAYPTLLVLTDVNGKEVKLPIRHFIQGAIPRMSYELFIRDED